MSLPRLSFLYPALRRTIITVPRRCNTFRHGSAVEPTQLHPVPPPPPPPPRSDSDTESKSRLLGTPLVAPENLPSDAIKSPAEPIAVKPPKQSTPAVSTPPTIFASAPTSEIANPTDERIPNTTAPCAFNPFETREYHFDTYQSVQKLSAGGLTEGQSVAVMKGIRGLLDKNMAAARDSLVSKSNIENESYLFQAACSELHNETETAKKVQNELLSGERTRIQTEFDLLNHAFLAEIMNLKDELNGMFNDRRMVTRAEQRAMENKIQELNYKITILINSDLKSEIEKLRWTTTRMGLMAIACLAIFVVASIRVNNSSHERKKRKEHEHHDESPTAIPPRLEMMSAAESETSDHGLISMG